MRVIVTGASLGIGGSTIRKLAQIANQKGEQLQIAACEITLTDDLKFLTKEVERLGADIKVLTGDLSEPECPAKIVDDSLKAFGGLDAVVSNAGITSPAPLIDLPVSKWDKLLNVNTRATLLLAQAAYPALKESKGALVAVASMSGMGAHPGMGAYSPSKAALISLCQVLAQEWACDGINVNTVSPGMIRTPLTQKVYKNNQIAKERAALVPWGRVGNPEDISNTISFLLSPEASYITGQNILVDGGFVDSLYRHIPGLPDSSKIDKN